MGIRRLAAAFAAVTACLAVVVGPLPAPAVAAVCGPPVPARGPRVIERHERWTLDRSGAVRRAVRRRLLATEASAQRLACFVARAIWPGGEVRVRRAWTASPGGGRVDVPPASVEVLPSTAGGGAQVQVRFPRPGPGTEFGVEFEETASRGAAAAFGFAPSHVFGEELPVDLDVFEVTVPSGQRLTWVARRMGDAASPVEESSGGQATWRWAVRGLGPGLDEPQAPPPAQRAPMVRASLLEGWGPVAGWLAARLERAMAPTPGLSALAAGAVAGAPDVPARAAALQRLVAARVRHVEPDPSAAVDLAATPALAVLERGYGDCVDRAVALAALLRAAGVTAQPVFLCTNRYRAFDPELPSVYCGDHCIVRVEAGSGPLFVDPGGAFHRFPLLPAEDQGAVVFEPASGSFLRTPATTAGEHGLDVDDRSTVGDDLVLRGAVTVRPRGEDEARLREALATAGTAEARSRVVAGALKLGPLAALTSLSWTPEATDTGRPLVVRGSYEDRGAAVASGGLVLLSLPLQRHGASEVAAPGRRFPLVYPTPTTVRVQSRVTLPPWLRLEERPGTEARECAVARYHRRTSLAGEGLLVEESWERRARVIPPEAYPAFKGALELRAAVGARPLVLRASSRGSVTPPAPAGSAGASPAAPASAEVALREVSVELLPGGRTRRQHQDVVIVRDQGARAAADRVVPLPSGWRLVSLEAATEVPGRPPLRVGAEALRSRPDGAAVLSFPGVEPGARLWWRAVVESPASAGPVFGEVALGDRLPIRTLRCQVQAGAVSGVRVALVGVEPRGEPLRADDLPAGRDVRLRWSALPSWNTAAALFRRQAGLSGSAPPEPSGGEAAGRAPAAVRAELDGLGAAEPVARALALLAGLRRRGLIGELFLARRPLSGEPAGGLPSLCGFDDALLRLAGQWYHPSTGPTPGRWPASLAGAELLSVQGSLTGLSRLPLPPAEPAALDELDAALAADGSLALGVRSTFRGTAAAQLREASGGAVARFLAAAFPGGRVRAGRLEQSRPTTVEVRLVAEVVVPAQAVAGQGGELLVVLPRPDWPLEDAAPRVLRCRLEGPSGLELAGLENGAGGGSASTGLRSVRWDESAGRAGPPVARFRRVRETD